MEGANLAKVKVVADAPRKPNRSLAGGGNGDSPEPVNHAGKIHVPTCCQCVSVLDIVLRLHQEYIRDVISFCFCILHPCTKELLPIYKLHLTIKVCSPNYTNRVSFELTNRKQAAVVIFQTAPTI